MTTSETRTIARFLGEDLTQQAIPWCTTHDSKRIGFNPELCELIAWDSNQIKHQIDDQHCVISTGGPDHKWWKDIE